MHMYETKNSGKGVSLILLTSESLNFELITWMPKSYSPECFIHKWCQSLHSTTTNYSGCHFEILHFKRFCIRNLLLFLCLKKETQKVHVAKFSNRLLMWTLILSQVFWGVIRHIYYLTIYVRTFVLTFWTFSHTRAYINFKYL